MQNLKKELEEILIMYIIVSSDFKIEEQKGQFPGNLIEITHKQNEPYYIAGGCDLSNDFQGEVHFSSEEEAKIYMKRKIEDFQEGFWRGTATITRRLEAKTRIFEIIWEKEPKIIEEEGQYYPIGYFSLKEKYFYE